MDGYFELTKVLLLHCNVRFIIMISFYRNLEKNFYKKFNARESYGNLKRSVSQDIKFVV